MMGKVEFAALVDPHVATWHLAVGSVGHSPRGNHVLMEIREQVGKLVG